ncbi:MAG: membrane protein insertase YidC [Rhodothermales bacterium]|nr:membrane protein insertase YidC [Rhodothermales bacterium]
MDRNTLIATVLITLIMMVWLFMISPTPQPPGADELVADSISVVDSSTGISDEIPQLEAQADVTTAPAAPIGEMFAGVQTGDEKLITVENEVYKAVFTSHGATLLSLELKEYYQSDRVTPVQMVDSTTFGAIGLLFTSTQNHLVDTRSLYFEPSTTSDRVNVASSESTLEFRAEIDSGTIVQSYTFTPDSYEIRVGVSLLGADQYAARQGYDIVWDGGIPFAEDNRKTEATRTGAYARTGGDVVGIDLRKDAYQEKSLNGSIDWVGVKTQYFTTVLIPDGSTRGAELIGERFGELDDPDLKEDYEVTLSVPIGDDRTDTFRIYVGPLEYYNLAAYKLHLFDMVDFGINFFEWMTRPLAKFIFIPLFAFLHGFIPSYGIVIIILALVVKGALYPLTKSSFKNMARMRELQPKMEAIKEKYPDNPQKQQEATMKMYKETGVNPLGGCLPMLLQYPVIIALWQFLPQSIEIRQQGFLWASDLSAPDKILQLPFEIPFYGDFVAGFTLLMGISLVVQMQIQSSSTASNPQMKMFTYLMPIMIFAIFNKFASGLSLYYLCYNVLTAVQQKYINKHLHDKDEEEPETNGRAGGKAVRGIKKKSSNGAVSRKRVRK